MSEFNPRQNDTVVPQYTGASQGQRYSADTSKGMLGEGMTKLFDGLIKGLDENVQENIRQDTQKGFDAINKEFGVDAAVATMGHPQPGPNNIADQTAENQPLPETIRRAGDQLNALSAAATQNPNLKAHFDARMQSLVRQLRGKYPGYRTEIDKITSEVTGMRPANQLRNELFQAWETGRTNEVKAYSDAVKKARDSGFLGGYTFNGAGQPIDPQTQQPMSFSKLQSVIADNEAIDANLKRGKAQMEFKAQQKTLTKDDARDNFTSEATTTVNRALWAGETAMGQNYQKLIQMVNQSQTNLATGGQVDANSLQQMKILAGQLQQELTTKLNGMYVAQWPNSNGDPTMRYSHYVDDKTREEIYKQVLLPLKTIQDAIDGGEKGNWGLLKAANTWLEANKDNNAQAMLKKYPTLNTLQALQPIIGPQATGLYMTLVPGLEDAIKSNILYEQKLKSQDPSAVNLPIDQRPAFATDVQNAIKDGKGGPDYVGGHLKAWTNEIRSKDLPPQMLANSAMYYFGPKNMDVWAKMNATDKLTFFTTMSSPEVSAKLKALETTHPEAYGQYRAWTFTMAQALVKDSVAELQQFNLDRREVMIAWDEAASRFTFVQNPNPRARTPHGVMQETIQDVLKHGFTQGTILGSGFQRQAQAAQAIEKLNRIIGITAPIIKDAGQDVGQQYRLLLNSFNTGTQGQRTVADFALQALTQAQAASEVGPDSPFKELTSVFQKYAPFNPQWSAPDDRSPFEGKTKDGKQKLQQNTGLDPQKTFVLGDSLGVGMSQAMRLAADRSLAQTGLRITDPKLVDQIGKLPQGATAVVSVGTNDAYAGENGVAETPAALNNLIRAAKERGVELVVVGPPKLPKNDEHAAAIDKQFQEIVKNNPGVRYVSSRNQDFQRAGDQLHMTPKGYQDFAILAGYKPPYSATKGTLDELIASGEGNYNSYNRGVAGDSQNAPRLNLVDMTLGEVFQMQRSRKVFAVGKFQIIPATMAEAIQTMKLDLNQKFTPELQHRINREFLIATKAGRDVIKSYITGATENLVGAQLALAQEFASIANPYTNRSHYAGLAGNAASISAARAAVALRAERQQYLQNIKAGMTPNQAWLALSGLK